DVVEVAQVKRLESGFVARLEADDEAVAVQVLGHLPGWLEPLHKEDALGIRPRSPWEGRWRLDRKAQRAPVGDPTTLDASHVTAVGLRLRDLGSPLALAPLHTSELDDDAYRGMIGEMASQQIMQIARKLVRDHTV